MKTMINVPVDKLDTVRYVRQLRSVVRWKHVTKARGTIEAATGFGKSTLGLIIKAKMEKMLKRPPHDCKVVIVVPTTPLRKQWMSVMQSLGLDRKVEVYVINTVALKENFRVECDLLIIDEIHLMAADKFSRIFQRVNYNWILGLTATLDRLDGKERLLKQYAPVCDSITQAEAIEKGWISNFIEFNLAVPVGREDVEKQKALNKEIRYYMSKFGDFNLMLSCLQPGNAKIYAQANDLDDKKVMLWARNAVRATHARKRLMEMPQSKIAVAIKLIKQFNLKTITFSEATEFADEVARNLGNKAEVYHSSVLSQLMFFDKSKVYKTVNGLMKRAEKLRAKEGVKEVVVEQHSLTVHWKQSKVVGSNTLAELALTKFERNEISVLCSAKALDQGFDDPSVELGVDASRSSNPTQHTQRTGRVARVFKLPDGKNAVKIYVNLYIPDWSVPNSRDEKKLRQCQVKNPEKVIWVDDIEHLTSMLNKILESRGRKLA